MRNNNHMRDNSSNYLVDENSQVYDVKPGSTIGRSLFIAVGLSFVVSFFIIMLNFVRSGVIINSFGLQIQSVISVILWLFLTIVVLITVSKQLEVICISNFSFGSMYTFSALPTVQLTIDISQSLNGGNLSAPLLVIFVTLINVVFVIAINLFLSKVKLTRNKIDMLILSLIIYCLFVVFVGMRF